MYLNGEFGLTGPQIGGLLDQARELVKMVLTFTPKS